LSGLRPSVTDAGITQQTKAKVIRAWVQSHLAPTFLWASVKPALLPIAVIGLFVAFVYREIVPAGPLQRPQAEDVAAEWSESIGRLGILPIFPPQEDFDVGDIWAVIGDSKKSGDGLLNRAVRLGHFDLRDDIVATAKSRPIFADTVALNQKENFRPQPRAEVSVEDDKKINLALTAFPGVTLSHTTRKQASLSLTAFGSGAARDSDDFEEISIPVAETYGASVEQVMTRFEKWCDEDDNKKKCSETYVRSMLAFAVDPAVNNLTKGAYDHEVHIQLVVRVFLTRQVEHRRRTSVARGGSLKVSSDGTAVSPAVSTTAPSSNASLIERNGAASSGLGTTW
jgi:hypothetical protein